LLRIEAASAQAASTGRPSPASNVLDVFGTATVLPHALTVLTNGANSFERRFFAAMWVIRAAPNLEVDTVNSLMTQCFRENRRHWATHAALMLAYRGAEPDLIVPYFTNQLTDPRWEVRMSAASALGRYHQSASNAVPGLVKVLGDTNPLTQQIAADALYEIDPDALEKAAPAKAQEKRELLRRFEQERRRFQQDRTNNP